MLPTELESMSVEVAGRLGAGRVRSDYYGVTCTDSANASYLFAISPDGYYSIAYDPGDDPEIQLERLVEENAARRFSARRAWNTLGGVCTPQGEKTSLRLTVNGRTIAKATHRHASGKFVGVALFRLFGSGRHRRPVRRHGRPPGHAVTRSGAYVEAAGAAGAALRSVRSTCFTS